MRFRANALLIGGVLLAAVALYALRPDQGAARADAVVHAAERPAVAMVSPGAEPALAPAIAVPRPAPPAAAKSLAELSARAVRVLGEKLSLPVLDVDCWDTQVVEQAKRLGVAACDELPRLWSRKDLELGQRVAAAAMLLELTPIGRPLTVGIEPEDERSLRELFEGADSRSHLALAAARVHLALGGRPSRGYWIEALERGERPELCARAFRGAREPAVVEELLRSLQTSADDARTARLVETLLALAERGLHLWLDAGLCARVAEELTELAAEPSSAAELRTAALRAAELWRKQNG